MRDRSGRALARSTPGWPPRPAGPRARRRRGAGRADPRDPRRRHRAGRAADHRRAQRRRTARGEGQPQAGRAGDARSTASPGCGCAAGSAPPSPSPPTRRCPTCWAGTSPRPRRTSATSATSPTCRSADGDEPVPGHGDRLLLPPAGRVGGRRPHAHRAGRRRAVRGPRHPRARWPGRSSTPTTEPSTRSKAFAQLCAELGVTQSMGAVGTSADNALAESFNATLKRETLQGAHCLARRGDVPPGGVPVGDPLQHPPPPLLVRPASPQRLRTDSTPLRCGSLRNRPPRVHYPGVRPRSLPSAVTSKAHRRVNAWSRQNRSIRCSKCTIRSRRRGLITRTVPLATIRNPV